MLGRFTLTLMSYPSSWARVELARGRTSATNAVCHGSRVLYLGSAHFNSVFSFNMSHQCIICPFRASAVTYGGVPRLFLTLRGLRALHDICTLRLTNTNLELALKCKSSLPRATASGSPSIELMYSATVSEARPEFHD